MTLYRKTTRRACDKVVNGNIEGAIDDLLYRRKTKTIDFGFRLGLVIGALMDPDDYNRPELAGKLLQHIDSVMLG